MEVVMQWLDEIDDLVSMVSAKSESLRRLLYISCASITVALTLAAAATLSLLQPAFAPALACALLVALLYRRQQNVDVAALDPARG